MSDGVPPDPPLTDPSPDDLERAWDNRVARLLHRLPSGLRRQVERVRQPGRPIARGGLGLLFVLGALLSVPRHRGLWLLPIGITLLGEGFAGWKAPAERRLRRWDPTLDRLNPSWRGR